MRVPVFSGMAILALGLGQVVARAQTAEPVFSPTPGVYTTVQVVTLSSATPGAAIYYTTNGDTPTALSSPYTEPIVTYGNPNLQAIAIAPGAGLSAVTGGYYAVETAEQYDEIDFSDGFSAPATLDINGSASLSGPRLRLTNGDPDQSSSVFYALPMYVVNFTTDFTFLLSNPTADGFTFTLQNSSPTAVGGDGAGLGYVNIRKSVAIKFDLYNNVGEGDNSTGVYSGGNLPELPAMDLTGSGIDLHSGDAMGVHMTYNGTVLNMTIIDQRTGGSWSHAYTIDIPTRIGSEKAYIGFTAATGGGTAIQDILSWTYSPDRPATPANIYYTAFVSNGSAVFNGLTRQLTSGEPYQAGSVFYVNAQNIQTFDASAVFQISDPDADGLTFTIQSTGPKALGGNGAGLGYVNIRKSVAIKLDLYNNAGEGDNSIGIFTGGNLPTVPALDLMASGVNLHSGQPINLNLSYNGSTLTVMVISDGASFTHDYTIDIPSVVGGTTAYVGFTGSTGAGTSTQTITQFFFDPGT